MHLDITSDPDTQTVEITYEDSIVLTVQRKSDGRVALSRSFDSISDEAEFAAIRKIAEILLNLA